jgi:Tol biopolymer transport system component/predicted Ser/Thr protein kinase
MLLTPGTRLGPYEITAPLGSGGMGEVYKARDTRLGRIVAVKVSKEEFSERFEREARAVAALNHSSICTLHDVGPNYLVMEYIEGTPLNGPLRLAKALEYAIQICNALDAAHKIGITHRDLKPANILVTKNGVKLLDFGLAKVAQDRPVSEATLTMALTGKNEIVGTLYYMSPEQLHAQATGQEVDARSDIFSFGLVLYEMLTGRRAFDGASPASVIAAIMERPAPSIAEIAPPALDRALKKCLAKDPNEPWQTVRDLRDELKWIASGSAEATQVPPAAPSRLPWIIVCALAVVTVATSWLAYHAPRRAELKPLVRLEVDLGRDVFLSAVGGSDVVISPDGGRIAYLSGGHLFTRKLDQPTATELTITPGATSPFFSPDGQWIGFVASGKLRKISAEGGSELILCEAGSSYTGADWGEDGNIVMALRPSSGLFRVSSAGGSPVPITQLQGDEKTHRWPQILPGGKAVMFTSHNAVMGYSDAKIEVMTLSDGHRKTLVHGGMFGRYMAGREGTGFLTYVNHGTLFAVAFDPERLETKGLPVPVLQQISSTELFGSAKISFSRSGTLLYRPIDIDSSQAGIRWLEADGKMQPLLAKPGMFVHPRLSPDGQYLAVRKEGANVGIWIYDLRRDTLSALAMEATAVHPQWTPDGRYIVYGTSNGMIAIRADGSDKPKSVTQGNVQYPMSFSPDGKRLAFYQYGSQGTSSASHIWTVTVDRDANGLKVGEPEAFAQTSATERDPSFSPDGRWLAYTSDESGTFQVYVRAFPDKGGRWQISNNSGAIPIFARNGKDLFFYSAVEDRIMVASYSVKGEAFVAEKPRVWSDHSLALALSGGIAAQYDVSADGKRLAAEFVSREPNSGHVIFLENFVDELQRSIPLGGK